MTTASIMPLLAVIGFSIAAAILVRVMIDEQNRALNTAALAFALFALAMSAASFVGQEQARNGITASKTGPK